MDHLRVATILHHADRNLARQQRSGLDRLYDNRRIFDQLWEDNCTVAAPLRRRLGLDTLGLVTEVPRDRPIAELRAELKQKIEAQRRIVRNLRDTLRN